MYEVLSLVKRNMKIFIRDKSSVFFSFLSVIILIGVYILFLGNNMRSWVIVAPDSVQWIGYLIDSNVMAGVLVVNSITITLGMFGNMIMDNQQGHIKGIIVAPINRFKIMLGYLISAWIMGIILTVFMFVLTEVYIVLNGGLWLSFGSMLKILGLIVFNVITTSSIMFFVVSLIKSSGGFSTLSTILGTVIGFICGIYIPIAAIGGFMETISKFIPFTYSAILMRQVYMKEAIDLVFAGQQDQYQQSLLFLGVTNVTVFGTEITPVLMIVFLSACAALFLFLTYLVLKKRKNN
jgi:multidrug/hemolysin transport system permease protein